MRDIVFLSLAACLVAACAATGSGNPTDGGSSNRGPSDGSDRSPMSGDQPVPEGCGNGERTADEACDDGNTEDGDGCAADCLAVEPGYACTPPGTPCRAIARCGDGVVHGSEPCDDGDTEDGDGCSSRCKLEIGFKCEGEPSVCTETVCGDGVREGAEACDDGNTRPFDGCSARCQAEPDCAGGACSSTCGDGLVIDEGCDDGNSKDGDGCSSSCEVEEGFECAAGRACDPSDPACRLRVPVIYRDFEQSHPDFEVGCGNLTPGLVDTRLSSQGKPVLVQEGAACIQSADSFAQWYTDADVNSTIVDELWLYGNGEGGFVNRYGPDGEPWLGEETFTSIVHGGPGGTGCPQCTPSPQGRCFDPCTPWGDGNTQACCAERSQASYDGNPLFFPIDDAPNARDDARFSASVPAQYGYDGWPPEDEVLMNAREHNFHFTTEVVYWFEYDASGEAILDFLGDDDVWVFINGQLAVDLGGPHVPREGSVTIDDGAADILDLEDGRVYEIRVFHAERKTVGSSFKLTLAGFDTARSQCEPICGDGIVSLGEECDDGDNDGGYEECAEGCTLGPRCGDGIVQEDEDCDDGNRRDGDGCGSSCRELVLL